VYELRGSGTVDLLKTLNEKFDPFGVLFSNATIVNVSLPQDLATALENATAYDARMRQQIRSQEFNLKVLNDDNDQQLKALFLENERLSAGEIARKERALIELQTKQSEFERQKMLAVVRAQQEVSVSNTGAKTSLETETLNTTSDMEFIIKRQQGESKAVCIVADQAADSEKIQSEASYLEAANRAKAILLEAEAESKVYEQMQQKRQYDLSWNSLKALQNLAQKGKMVISGEYGKVLLDSVTSGINGTVMTSRTTESNKLVKKGH
jgi:hypothetical protein